ncbi:molecular chaperone DnaJ [Pseudohyphozyma bogoriensis]|nr:molecular chaperone DnaJ [Pseudohyphozyma bogoriensis]
MAAGKPLSCLCRSASRQATPSSAAPIRRISTSAAAPSSSSATKRSQPAQVAHGSSWSSRVNSWSTKRHEARRGFHSSARVLAKDPYSVLGVAKDASSSDIKKTYYGLAKKYHPDSNKEPSAKAKFMEIQEAYDILSDDKKRADFDRYGAASQQQGFDSEAYARATSSFGGGFGDFFGGGGGGAQSDLFESLFGSAFRGAGGGARPGQARPGQSQPIGEDIEVSLSIPFIDAAKGTTRTVATTPVVDCPTCEGSGLKAGAKKTTCGVCHGSGTRTFTIQSGFQMASTCNACGGTGEQAPPGANCGGCAGVGKVRERKTVEVEVPPGVDNGMKIRVSGKGDAPIGGKGRSGDLFVRINVLPSKVFTRQGSNLYQEVGVPFYTAILGGRARVATLDQDVEVKVPNGTQPGEEMVLRGRGVKKLYKEEYGDLVVKFGIQMPRSLSAAQRRILEQFVQETEFPGSSEYAPQKPKPKPEPTPEVAPDTPPPTPPPSESSPLPEEPVSESETVGKGKKWWADMESPEEMKKEFTAAQDKPSTPTPPPPPPPSSEPEATPSSSKESGSPKKEAAEEEHSVLGDLWKGKEKLKKAKKDKVEDEKK